MLTVVDRMPWSILSVLFGRDIDVMTKMHGDVYTNVLLLHVPMYHDEVAILEG